MLGAERGLQPGAGGSDAPGGAAGHGSADAADGVRSGVSDGGAVVEGDGGG